RSPPAQQQRDETNKCKNEHNPSKRHRGPRSNECVEETDRESTWRWIAVEHVDTGKILTALARQSCPVSRNSSAGDGQRYCPQQRADCVCHCAAKQCSGGAAARALQEHEQQKWQRQHCCLGAESDRDRRQERS